VSIILNIDTAVEISSVCLAKNDQSLGLKINPSQKDSAAWLHMAIKELMNECGLTFQQLDAIAVSEGPGSYTGLRVGMATAKGLCYVLQKPLIAINTLQMMTIAAQKETSDYLCPMIDARRMEVFAAVFDHELNFIMPSANLVLNEHSFEELLDKHTISFFGNGSSKFQQLIRHSNASFKAFHFNASLMISLSKQRFFMQDFAELAYSQPFYGKDFHSSVRQSL
jgi:tRNA threonylcarbamoyladenosine biosynthesis protein TsaB